MRGNFREDSVQLRIAIFFGCVFSLFCFAGVATASSEGLPAVFASKQGAPVAEISTISYVDDPGAIRTPIRSQGVNPQLDLFRDALGLMMARDEKGQEDDAPSQKQVLAGYTAIRAVHGIVTRENDWPWKADPSFKQAELAKYDRLSRGVICPDAMTAEVCSTWDRCVHSAGTSDRESLDFPVFLLWHRAYVRAFELSLRNALRTSNNPKHRMAADSFGIPYWPWLDQQSRKLPEEFSEDYESGCAEFSGASNPLLDCFRSEPVQTGKKQVWDAESTLNPFDIDDVDWASFSGTLEDGWHQAIHQGIAREDGMDMGISMLAVRDPVFWVHHAFIDLLLTKWVQGNQDLIDDALKDGLKKAWNDKNFKFPIVTVNGVKWYEPKFDNLDFSAVNPMGYKYAAYIIPSENIGQKSIAYHNEMPEKLFSSEPVKSNNQLSSNQIVAGSWTTKSFIPSPDEFAQAAGEEKFNIGTKPAHFIFELTNDEIDKIRKWDLWRHDAKKLGRRRVILQLDLPNPKDSLAVQAVEKFDLFLAPTIRGSDSFCAPPKHVGSFGWFGIKQHDASHEQHDSATYGKAVDITQALAEHYQNSRGSERKDCQDWFQAPMLTLIVQPRLVGGVNVDPKLRSLEFASLTLLIRKKNT